MQGLVDSDGLALLTVPLIIDEDLPPYPLEAWIDTGFTGDLVIPSQLIRELGLVRTSIVDGILADGSQVRLEVFDCQIDWFSTRRRLEVLANSGEMPLLGIGLLMGNELRIDYSNNTVSLLPVSRT